ncbi:MAG: hypothetical protein PVG65_02180 [Candidatus Thorarchaeota archaeon]|jgi:hypothetical protein
MVVRIKGGAIDQIEDTETRHLKLMKLSHQEKKIKLTLELPAALCNVFESQETVDVRIDSKPMKKGKKAQLYVEGTVFRIKNNDKMEVTGTMGGLRLTVLLRNPTPAKRRTFESDRLFLMIK